MPAAARALWERLYAETPPRGLPWASQGPFPPLVRVVEQSALSPPGPVLDIGCGVGTNSYWLAGRGFRVTGIDIARGAVSSAESLRGPDARNPVFLVDDVLESALPAAAFRAAVDVGCFQTLPTQTRTSFSTGLARLLAPGAPYLLFWVGREETGSWGPPHRLSVRDVVTTFESSFLVDRIEYRPRTVRLTPSLKRSARPLATLAGYTARLVRRRAPQPPPR
ncbi:MAG: methyltransferase domain-containing protein [Thermoplasmata archaeon]|nr:methyltransferase domain-containing protein [Thermoplasmata archaeon]